MAKVQATDDGEGGTTLPEMQIPGSYGIPFISAINDRLDFYYRQGQDGFFKARQDKYGSTVFRSNMPPGPFMASNPRVVVLLDAKSFPVLFDMSKIEKRDVLAGTYMPTTKITGGYRVCAYLDPSEPNHAKIKQLLLKLLASRKPHLLPAFHAAYTLLFDEMESQLAAAAGAKSDFNKLNDNYAFEFLGDAFFSVKPSSVLGSGAADKTTKWLLLQLAPLVTLGLPKILEEIFLHTFPLPSIIARSDYNALYSYITSAAYEALDDAEKLGLSREEACHNLLFATVFNSYGGFKVLFPNILALLAKADKELHQHLATEVRQAVKDAGGVLTLAALEKMELVLSVVYEALRIDPPVKSQYGKAKMDFVIESHDASFRIKKDEMLFGYQPFATRDPKVFGENAGEFVSDRFLGEKGKALVKYVFWSNGPETASPTVGNKQCAGKNFVVLAARLLVAEFFLRYDTFTAEVNTVLLGAQVTMSSVAKAAAV